MRMEIRENFLILGNRYSHFAITFTCAISFYQGKISDEGEAEFWDSDLPTKEKFLSDMHFFLSPNQCAVVPTKSWRTPHIIAFEIHQKRRLKSIVNIKEHYSHLYIRDSQPGVSATYFHAMQAQPIPACTQNYS